MVAGEITIIADVCAIYLEAKINKKKKFVKIKLLIHIFQRFVIKINSIFVLCILAASTASASESKFYMKTFL